MPVLPTPPRGSDASSISWRRIRPYLTNHSDQTEALADRVESWLRGRFLAGSLRPKKVPAGLQLRFDWDAGTFSVLDTPGNREIVKLHAASAFLRGKRAEIDEARFEALLGQRFPLRVERTAVDEAIRLHQWAEQQKLVGPEPAAQEEAAGAAVPLVPKPGSIMNRSWAAGELRASATPLPVQNAVAETALASDVNDRVAPVGGGTDGHLGEEGSSQRRNRRHPLAPAIATFCQKWLAQYRDGELKDLMRALRGPRKLDPRRWPPTDCFLAAYPRGPKVSETRLRDMAKEAMKCPRGQ